MTIKTIREVTDDVLSVGCKEVKFENDVFNVLTRSSSITTAELERLRERLGISLIVGVYAKGDNLGFIFKA